MINRFEVATIDEYKGNAEFYSKGGNKIITGECLCGSRKPVNQCCIPDSAPIHMEIPPYIQSSKVHRPGVPFIFKQQKMTFGLDSGPSLLAQVDPLIANALGFDLNNHHLHNASERNTLIFPLHAVRYHQKQFLYRLKFIQVEISKMIHLAANDPYVDLFKCDDVPLRSEFESFISRMAAFLDAMAKYIAKSLKCSKDRGSHKKIQIYLSEQNGGKRREQQSIRETYEAHQGWTREMLKIRNEIMHQGVSMDMSFPADFFETREFIPKVNEKSVEELITSYWSNLLEFTRTLIFLTS